MSTNARFGILSTDGSVMSGYIHWDGNPKVAGKMLEKHYTDPESVGKLVLLGDIMDLGQTHEECRIDSSDSNPGPRDDDTKLDYLSQREEYMYLFWTDNKWMCYAGTGKWITIDAAIKLYKRQNR